MYVFGNLVFFVEWIEIARTKSRVCAQSGAPPRDGDALFVSIREPKLPHAAMQSLRATPNIAGRRAIDAAGSRTSPSTRRAVTRSPVKSTAYLTVDPDQYDPDANSGRGSGFVPSGAVSSHGGGVRPSRVTRGADGVVYDPDQYDADANQRSGTTSRHDRLGARRDKPRAATPSIRGSRSSSTATASSWRPRSSTARRTTHPSSTSDSPSQPVGKSSGEFIFLPYIVRAIRLTSYLFYSQVRGVLRRIGKHRGRR